MKPNLFNPRANIKPLRLKYVTDYNNLYDILGLFFKYRMDLSVLNVHLICIHL